MDKRRLTEGRDRQDKDEQTETDRRRQTEGDRQTEIDGWETDRQRQMDGDRRTETSISVCLCLPDGQTDKQTDR